MHISSCSTPSTADPAFPSSLPPTKESSSEELFSAEEDTVHSASSSSHPPQELSPAVRASLTEGYDVAISAEPPRSSSLRSLPSQKSHPKIEAIRYRVPKPFVRPSSQNLPPISPQKHLFTDEGDLQAEEILLDSD